MSGKSTHAGVVFSSEFISPVLYHGISCLCVMKVLGGLLYHVIVNSTPGSGVSHRTRYLSFVGHYS